MPRFGGTEILLLVVIVVLLFGAARLPKLARSMREARNELQANDTTHPSAGEERAGTEQPSSTLSGLAGAPGSSGPGSEGGASS